MLDLLLRSSSASLSIEHGLIKLLVSKGETILEHRVLMANPRFFREGHVNNATRVASVIEGALPSMDAKFQHACAVVPGFQNRIKIMEFPKASGFDPRAIIGQEAARTMKVTPESYYLTWKQLPDSFDRSRWLVLAAHRRAITSVMETTKRAKIKVSTLELRPFALARAVNRPEAVIAWAAPDGCDVVIVKDFIPVEHQSLFWGAEMVEDTVLVDRLTEAVGRTIANFNETSPVGPVPEDTPVYTCGSPVSRGPALSDESRGASIAQQVARSLRLPRGDLEIPMEAEAGFPVDDLVVNVGLNLRNV